MTRRGAEARQRLTDALYPCATAGCGATADYHLELRHLEPRRKVRRNGVEKIIEPYATEHLCGPCTTARVASDDPPRAVQPLKHKAAELAAEAAAERARVKQSAKTGDGRLWGGGLAMTPRRTGDLGLIVMAVLFAIYVTAGACLIAGQQPAAAPPADVTTATAAPAVIFTKEP